MLNLREPRQKYSTAIATEDDILLAESLHKYVNEKIMPRRRDLEGGAKRDEELADKTFKYLSKGLVELGIQKAFLPKEIGGLGLTSQVTGCIIAEEIARGDIGILTNLSITPWVFEPAMITKNMTVLEKFAAPFCGDEVLHACFSMTEPAGGCNMEDASQHGKTIRTIAELKEDEWVINGQKLWPSNAGVSEVYCTICTVDPNMGDDGIAIIYVPKDAEGLSFGEPEEKMGLIYTDRNSAIYYDNVRVPREYCCGQPGGEGAAVFRHCVSGRITDGPTGVGAAQAALEIVIDYTKDRYIKGKTVRDRSLHASILGEMAMKIQVARSDYMYVASMFDDPETYGQTNSHELIARASASKMFSTRMAIEVITKAIEMMGSYGYSPDYHVEKYLRDVIIVDLWMGGPHLCSLDVARSQYPLNLW